MRWWPVLVWWLCWSGAGVAVIALPDADRVVGFSEAHGPGVLDLLGIAALLVGALGPWLYLWRGRSALREAGQGASTTTGVAAGVGLGLLMASVFSDFAGWWAVGAALLVAVQGGAFAAIARSGAAPGGNTGA